MKISFSPIFVKQFRKLPEHIRLLAEEKIKLFRKSPFASQLKTHKLHGSLRKLYAFSVNQKYRIVFRLGDDMVFFHYIGSHDIY